MSSARMLAEKSGVIGRMIFNNPERHNAVSLEMWDAAEAILDDFLRDDQVRVIVISGAGGKAFVSGADISKFESERAGREAVDHYNARVSSVYDRLANVPKPTIAMINGYCLGGGLGLSVACDLRFCSSRSRFGLPAARLGLGYPYDRLKQLVDTVGPGATKDIVFSARQLTAEEALAVGLVQKILPAEELEAFVTDYASRIGRNAPMTVRATKLIIGEVLKPETQRNLAFCRKLVDACFDSEDYIEGRRAFTEKREPRFKGR